MYGGTRTRKMKTEDPENEVRGFETLEWLLPNNFYNLFSGTLEN